MKPKDLEILGFTEKQATVYLAVLELGGASADRIARQAALPKSTTYDILRSLTAQGLLHVFLQKSRKRFTAADPVVLIDRLKNRFESAEKILPDLLALFGKGGQKPRIRYFEGKGGVKTVLNEILDEAREILALAAPEIAFDKLSEYFPRFARERVKRKIPIKIIMKDTPLARDRKEKGTTELRQIKLVPVSEPFPALIYVWNNKTSIAMLGDDLILIVIESRDLAKTLRAVFGLLWPD